MYRLYTPGHGLVTDSLILHGLLKILSWCEVNKGEVSRLGDRFIILLDHEPKCSSEIIEDLLEEVLILIKEYNKGYQDAIYVSDRISKINYANINRPVLKNWLNAILDALNKPFNLEVYKDADHISKFEKKRRSKNLLTLYLPLSGVYGKYSQEAKIVSEGPYKVCDTCFVVSNIGLIYGTYIIRIAKKQKVNVYYTTLIPKDAIDIRDLYLLQKLTEGYYLPDRVEESVEISLISAPLVAFSQGETIASIEKPHKIQVLTWALQLANNFQRSLGLLMIDYKPLYEFIANIKLKIPSWHLFLTRCLVNVDGGETVLTAISEALLFGGDIYGVSRVLTSHIMSILKNDKLSKDLKDLCKIDVDEIVNSLYMVQSKNIVAKDVTI
jgi:CRISPR-associated protein Csa4